MAAASYASAAARVNQDVKAKLEATKYEIDQKNKGIANLEEHLRRGPKLSRAEGRE